MNASAQKGLQIRTDIGTCTTERIHVRGRDLADELIGRVDFIDMMGLVILNRTLSGPEKDMLNAVLVTVMDHGFTPSSIAARLTYLGAPEAPQAAVAAGLLGAGSVFLGAMENACRMLREIGAAVDKDAAGDALNIVLRRWLSARQASGQKLFGLGHNLHVNGDPRIPALKRVAIDTGFYGHHWRVLEALGHEASSARGRLLPINAAGAIGAVVADMGLPDSMARGLALIGRTAGLIGHIMEEQQHPTGAAIWELVLVQDERNTFQVDASGSGS